MDAGVLKVIKSDAGFSFTNPGSLKLLKEQIYKGGDSKPRNSHMQTMLRMVGFGDNAGPGFPDILKTWANNGWKEPELVEDTILNHVSLTLQISTAKNESNLNEEKAKSQNFVQNERTLKEVLKEADFKKVLPLIDYLDVNSSITPAKAKEIYGKSESTIWRYLNILTGTGYVVSEGNTNESIYKKCMQ